jgi:hypothetical protein
VGAYDGTWTSSLSSAPGSAPLTFTVSGGRVTSFTTKVDVYCSGSFGGTAKEDFKPADSPVIAPDGTFSSQVKSPTSHRTTLTYMGKLSPDGTARGSLRLNKFNSNAFTNTYTTCNAAGSWSART